MKDEATKIKFIELRAAGKSLANCASELKIAKTTAAAWDKDLGTQVATMKGERLEALYQEYGMMKEARIKSIGTILKKVDVAIKKKLHGRDLQYMDIDKLIDLRMKLHSNLMKEYTTPAPTIDADGGDNMRATFMAFLMKVQSGEIGTGEIKKQAEAIAAVMCANKATKPETAFKDWGF